MTIVFVAERANEINVYGEGEGYVAPVLIVVLT
jgi:hypothetical protein